MLLVSFLLQGIARPFSSSPHFFYSALTIFSVAIIALLLLSRILSIFGVPKSNAITTSLAAAVGYMFHGSLFGSLASFDVPATLEYLMAHSYAGIPYLVWLSVVVLGGTWVLYSLLPVLVPFSAHSA